MTTIFLLHCSLLIGVGASRDTQKQNKMLVRQEEACNPHGMALPTTLKHNLHFQQIITSSGQSSSNNVALYFTQACSIPSLLCRFPPLFLIHGYQLDMGVAGVVLLIYNTLHPSSSPTSCDSESGCGCDDRVIGQLGRPSCRERGCK